MSKRYIIPIFVPHLGCPKDCVFCNQRSISGQQKMITTEEIKNQILIAESIIVGEIPSSYYNFNGTDNKDALEVIE